MGEFVGSDTFVALQKRLQANHGELARNPLVSNGGRILNILDADAFGWDNIRKVAERDKCVGLTMVDREPTLRKLSKIFGGTVEFPYWQVFTGQPANVLAKSAFVLSETPLSEGWRVQSYTHPDEATIAQSQALNSKAGVAPAPAYYLRGHVIPSTLCCIYDA